VDAPPLKVLLDLSTVDDNNDNTDDDDNDCVAAAGCPVLVLRFRRGDVMVSLETSAQDGSIVFPFLRRRNVSLDSLLRSGLHIPKSIIPLPHPRNEYKCVCGIFRIGSGLVVPLRNVNVRGPPKHKTMVKLTLPFEEWWRLKSRRWRPRR
jgi:hypothetical protein